MTTAPVPAAAPVPVRPRSTLSKAEWNDLERAVEIAKRNGGGKARVGKVSITLPWSSVASKPPVKKSASRTAPQKETPRPSFDRQRNSKRAARQRTFIARKKVTAVALKAMLRYCRWLRMQEVWTAFMRDSVQQQPFQTSVVMMSSSVEEIELESPTQHDITGAKRSPGSRSKSAQLALRGIPQRSYASATTSPFVPHSRPWTEFRDPVEIAPQVPHFSCSYARTATKAMVCFVVGVGGGTLASTPRP